MSHADSTVLTSTSMCFYISGQAGEEEGAAVSLRVEVVLNPLSKAAQRVAPILEWLRSSFHASIKVAPKPKQKPKTHA